MFSEDRILGLDIGAATVKLGEFHVSSSHGLRLSNFNYADLGLDPEHDEARQAQIVSTIRNVLQERRIRSGKVVFSVSGQQVFTRFVKLPPVEEAKVAQIIQYEAQQNVPFPIDEVVWDYQLVGGESGGELDVVLLAIKSKIIEELNDSVQAAGLRTTRVDVAPMALYNALRYNYGDLEGCTVLLDIGARTTNLLFVEKNKLFTRSIPIAGNAITQSITTEFNVSFAEAEQLKKKHSFVALGGAYEEPEDQTQARISKICRNVMTRLHAEVGRSINYYRTQQGGSAPARVFLSGGSSIIPYTDRFFQEKIQVPIEYFNPFRNVEIDPHVSREELQRCAHFFGEVVGLGLRQLTECPVEVNLLPSSLRSRRRGEQRRPYLVGIALCVLLIPYLWWGYSWKMAELDQRKLDEVKKHAEDLQKIKEQIDSETSRLDAVKGKSDQIVSLVNERSLWPDFMQDFNRRVAAVSNLWIVSFQPQTTLTESRESTTFRTPMGRLGAMPGMMGMPPGPPGGAEGFAPTPRPTVSTSALPPGTEILVSGAGHRNFTNPEKDVQLVNSFAQNLRESPYIISNSVEITALPDPMSDNEWLSFSLKFRLNRLLFK